MCTYEYVCMHIQACLFVLLKRLVLPHRPRHLRSLRRKAVGRIVHAANLPFAVFDGKKVPNIQRPVMMRPRTIQVYVGFPLRLCNRVSYCVRWVMSFFLQVSVFDAISISRNWNFIKMTRIVCVSCFSTNWRNDLYEVPMSYFTMQLLLWK